LCALNHRRWQALRWDGETWWLQPRDATIDETPVRRVDVVADLGNWLAIRLQTDGRWRLWPREVHLVLRQTPLAGQWAVLRAALARQRAWFGDQRA
jgi:hypothetical protein